MLISNPFPPEEGIGFYTYNLSKKLIERGHEVTVITRGNARDMEKSSYDGIKIYKPQFFPFYPFHVQIHQHFVKNLLYKDLKDNFDLLHVHSPLSPVMDVDIPIVGTIHTSLVEDLKHFQTNNLKSMAIRFTTNISGRPLTQKLIDKAACITTVSSSVAEELKLYYTIKNPTIVGNGVNEKFFFPVDTKQSEPYLLYVGRLDYRKGILDLIQASIILKNSNIKLLVAGEGPLKPYFEKQITENNLNVNLLGQVSGPNLVELYQNALMFVFPSHYEGLPTVVLEAMSSGLPVIVTDIPAYRDIIINKNNGLTTKKGNPEDLVDKIRFLLENNDLREKLGICARETIKNRYTWDIISKKFEQIYSKVVGDLY